MKSSGEISSFGIVFECLAKIWEPGAEAYRTQKELGVGSLDETVPAIERAGYEVNYVDLPDKVSGFAEIIADKRHIILNRQKSPQNLQYTVPHELAHHILHLSPVPEPDSWESPGIEGKELQADLFAASWLMFLGNDERRNAVLLLNPHSSRAIVSYLFLTILVTFVALMMHFLRPLFETK
jgi:IrrE N-terminal-like domain